MNSAPGKTDTVFAARLTRLRRAWQGGLLLRDALRLLRWIAVAAGVYGVLDFFLALDPGTRGWINLGLGIGFAFIALVWLIRESTLTDRHMAERTDRILESRRHSILSAFELDRWLQADAAGRDSLSAYLAGESIAEAAKELSRIAFRRYFPFPELGRQLAGLAACLAVISLLVAVAPGQMHTCGILAQRIVFPNRDIPPYTPYRFTVTPQQPSVMYGGDIEIHVDVTGGPVPDSVWFVSRRGNQVQRTACFQEGTNRFAQRLEKVVPPVEFCFAVKKARTRWMNVNVLMQPKIAVASVTVTPPAYTRLPRRQFFVGADPLAAIQGSAVELTLRSNRPLLDGMVTIRPRDGLGNETPVAGRKSDNNSVVFEWIAREPAVIEASIRDIQGTKNRDPYRIEQKLIPDAPPNVVISEPSTFALATPSATVPLVGYADDDLALSRVELVRTVAGYRDRVKPVGPASADRRFDLNSRLDMAALGTEPGQILELYMEAADMNPALTGNTASDVVRIQVISDEEYATIVRARTTIDEFVARFRIVERRMTELRDAVNDLLKKAEAQPRNSAAVAKALENVRRLNSELAGEFDSMSEEFSIYDVEKDLASLLANLADTVRDNQSLLKNVQPDDPGLAVAAREMLRRLGEHDGAIAQHMERAKEIEAVARVMETALEFKRLTAEQSALVRRLARFEKETPHGQANFLGSLGNRQAEIHSNLVELTYAIGDCVGRLPDTYITLRKSAIEFLEKIAEYKIASLMKTAVDAAANRDGPLTHRNSLLALEAMQQLLEDQAGTEFGAMAKDGGMKFDSPDAIRSTLEKMLTALAMQLGGMQSGERGDGTAAGGSGAGDAKDGYWTGGNSPLNVPAFGPSRADYREQVQGFAGSRTGQGGGPGGTGAGNMRTSASEQMNAAGKTTIPSESLPLENVPARYRDAVKRYFETDNNGDSR